MKIGRLEVNGGAVLAAAVEDGAVDLSSCGPWLTVQDAIAEWKACRPVFTAAVESGRIVTGPVKWLAPLPAPPKFLLLAGNFREHVVESGFAPLPEAQMTPQFFSKPSTTIIGTEHAIPLTDRNTALDYESELAVVVGRRLKHGTVEEARAAVWGYTVVNDVSERKLNGGMTSRQLRQNDQFFDWLTGKWFDGSAPMGPFVVTADEIPSPERLTVRAFLNGAKVQEAPATAMVHDIGAALSYISEILTLEPGDVVSMGTPSGVGMARGRLLQNGDLIECEVEGIGRIRNRVEKL